MLNIITNHGRVYLISFYQQFFYLNSDMSLLFKIAMIVIVLFIIIQKYIIVSKSIDCVVCLCNFFKVN